MNNSLPFAPSLKARANLRAGAIYAIDGGDSYIYYGQVAEDKSIGFFNYRSTELSSVKIVAAYTLMSRFGVNYQSIGQALRAGAWHYLGSSPILNGLHEPSLLVQWPIGSVEVQLWKGSNVIGTAKIHDPEIQDLEVIAAYDAIHHVPERLQADFGTSVEAWTVGGLVWRERIKKEKMAARFPDIPWHALPNGWVYVERTI